jgi:ATP-binding cassette, subfamily B, bacterial PglK
MSDLKKFLKLLTPLHKKRSIVLLILMVVGTFFEILGVGLVLPMISVIINPELLKEYLYFFPVFNNLQEDSSQILALWALLILLFAYILKGLFLIFLSWYQTKYAFEIQSSLSLKLFNLYINKDWLFHVNTNSSKIIRNIVGEVSTLVSNFVLPMLTIIIETMVLIGIAILLVIVEPKGSILAIVFLTASGGIFYYLTKSPLQTWGKKLQFSEKERILHIQQAFGCFKEVKMLNCESFFVEKYQESNLDSANFLRKNTFMQAVPRVLIEILAIIGVVILAMSVMDSGKSDLVPVLGLFAAAAFRIMPSSTRLINSIQYVQNSKAVLDNIYNELQVKAANIDYPNKSELTFNNLIEIKNLSFQHGKSKSFSLDNINFKIIKGTCTGIVGASGSGKSTIIDLVLGLISPSNGSVLVDGVDICKNMRAWQSNIGYIPQNMYLIDDSIRNNVALGVPEKEISDERVWDVLEKAQLKSYILNQENGLDTVVGEHGAKFSGGQRQRIGIARALYHDPEFLILDESTSALDVETEKSIMNTFSLLMKEKTILIVTHRLNTLEFCNNIIRVENGKVVKTGTFSDIVNS